MRFPVFLDTCVLYPALVADVLLRLGEEGAYSPHWSAQVLTELDRSLAKIPSVGADGARRKVEALRTAFPEASVSRYEGLIDDMTCSAEDRHVLAAAAYAQCQVLVTYNTRDFPDDSASPLGITVVTPDRFLLDQLDLHPRWVIRTLSTMTRELRKPRVSPSSLLDSLDRSGLPGFTTELVRRYPVGTWEAMS